MLEEERRGRGGVESIAHLRRVMLGVATVGTFEGERKSVQTKYELGQDRREASRRAPACDGYVK